MNAGSDPGGHPLSLAATARACGLYRWVEERLFEITGSWVGVTPDSLLKVHFHQWSRLHGWHAELWASRRPLGTAVEHAGDDPPPEDHPVVSSLRALGALNSSPKEDDDDFVLAGLSRAVIPLVRDAYRAHLRRTSSVADGPMIRVLGLVLVDAEVEIAEGEALLRRRRGAGDARSRRGTEVSAFVEGLRARLDGSVLVPTAGMQG